MPGPGCARPQGQLPALPLTSFPCAAGRPPHAGAPFPAGQSSEVTPRAQARPHGVTCRAGDTTPRAWLRSRALPGPGRGPPGRPRTRLYVTAPATQVRSHEEQDVRAPTPRRKEGEDCDSALYAVSTTSDKVLLPAHRCPT